MTEEKTHDLYGVIYKRVARRIKKKGYIELAEAESVMDNVLVGSARSFARSSGIPDQEDLGFAKVYHIPVLDAQFYSNAIKEFSRRLQADSRIKLRQLPTEAFPDVAEKGREYTVLALDDAGLQKGYDESLSFYRTREEQYKKLVTVAPTLPAGPQHQLWKHIPELRADMKRLNKELDEEQEVKDGMKSLFG